MRKPEKRTHTVQGKRPSLPAQVGLVKSLGSRLECLSSHQFDLLVAALQTQKALRRKRSDAQLAYMQRLKGGETI